MMIAVQGSKSFSDYSVFMRAMAVAMSDMEDGDKDIFVYTVGPKQINNFVAEFCNITENSLKSRGLKIKFYRVPISWVEENINDFNYFIYLAKPGEPNSKLVAQAELNGVEVGTFKY
jgi:hypothetical protein